MSCAFAILCNYGWLENPRILCGHVKSCIVKD